MQKYYLLILLTALSFTGCFDTVEEVTIRDNGTGSLSMKMDMGKAFEMMQRFMSDSDLQRESMNKPIDTIIMLSNIIDTAQNIPADQKALLREGVGRINMDMPNNVFKVNITYPFKNTAELTKLYGLVQENDALKELFKSLPGRNMAAPGDGADSADAIPQLNNIYDIQVKDGVYAKTVNKEKYKQLKENPRLEEIKGMMAMMGDMNYTMVMSFPRPVKKLSNTAATLSADKKTVTLKNALFDAFDKPESLEISIEY